MFDFLCSDAACSAPIRLAQILAAVFLAMLFLQSGIDKVTDRRGNLDWLTGHFASSPLAGRVPMLLTVVTVLELVAGGLSALGALALLLAGTTGLAVAGAAFSSVSIVCLFLGQRLAKDYEGAAVLAGYFTLTLLVLYLLGV